MKTLTNGLRNDTRIARAEITGGEKDPPFHGLNERIARLLRDESMAPCRVPPVEVHRASDRDEDEPVHVDCSLNRKVRSEQRCREQDEGDQHEQQDIDPKERSVRNINYAELGVVSDPVDAEHDETDRVHDESRQEAE